MVEPRLQPDLPDANEAVEGAGQVVQFGADPADDFENRGVLGIEVGEVDDAFVVKDAVAKIADAFPAGIEFDHVALGAGSAGEGLFGQIVAEAAPGVDLVKKSGPETEAQFGDHPAGRHGLFAGEKILAGFTNAQLLPAEELGGGGIIPGLGVVALGERTVLGVAQGDLRPIAAGNTRPRRAPCSRRSGPG